METETDRQTDRQPDAQADRQTKSKNDRETETDKDKEQNDRQIQYLERVCSWERIGVRSCHISHSLNNLLMFSRDFICLFVCLLVCPPPPPSPTPPLSSLPLCLSLATFVSIMLPVKGADALSKNYSRRETTKTEVWHSVRDSCN